MPHADMPLQEWISNFPKLNAPIKQDNNAPKSGVSTTKLLGLVWYTETDAIGFKPSKLDKKTLTKRDSP